MRVRPGADVDQHGDVASDEGRDRRALSVTAAEGTGAGHRTGDPGDASWANRSGHRRQTSTGRPHRPGVLQMGLGQRGRGDERDQQAVLPVDRLPARGRDIGRRRRAGQTGEVASQRVDIGLTARGGKRLPRDAGIGRHERHQQRVAGCHGTAVGRTVRHRAGVGDAVSAAVVTTSSGSTATPMATTVTSTRQRSVPNAPACLVRVRIAVIGLTLSALCDHGRSVRPAALEGRLSGTVELGKRGEM